ncbi:crosslink repair DNA glycosylase YcaQ family protein [Amylibacter sp. IMCC11727]|uniref:winged helix-turn-helix domain-containing protein n=1 Tax=Amylibacter sp. IMCC11727 TaxID=3039851 RepID=UPI00244DBCA7|nr:crosslink repair DNA glycosylase YcaQ family protein [Amylibacter sp. IMCC11727]WGI21093.1 crosslink repair DNA glycosylase YcaQ family protein [Amylibacter sp. IMCC11727]
MLRLSNKQARRLWLHTNGIAQPQTGPADALQIIRDLGFVQIDTIRNVTRAHHHILWSRNPNYREKQLWPLLGKHRQIFEHFTHDASLIPMEFYPMWGRQFARMAVKMAKWYPNIDQATKDDIFARIKAEGALSTHAFDTKIEGPREMWARPPHKKALDLMWYDGTLSTCFRENFTKFYNLTDRVVPDHLRTPKGSDTDQINWLCTAAMERLNFATQGEIQRFWEAMDAKETRRWTETQTHLIPVEIERADRTTYTAFAHPDIEHRLANSPDPTSRLQLLNPFDPAIRDRTRLAALFGFEYVNEMFLPAAKRRWGYYVYPLLERDRFVGRIELKADRSKSEMYVTGFWPEPGVKWSTARHKKLDTELTRFARLASLKHIDWQAQRA